MIDIPLFIQQVGFPIFAAVWLLLESRNLRKSLETRLEQLEKSARERERDLQERIRELELVKDHEMKAIAEEYKEAMQQVARAMQQASINYGKLEQAVRDLCREAPWRKP